jgi:O-antigen/teichoic acid export membrane protein
LAIVIPTLLISLSDAGMNFALVRLPARLRSVGNLARASRLIRLRFLLKLAISTVAFLICYTGSTVIATTVLNRSELAPFLQLASLIIIFQAIFDVTNNSFIGQDLMQYSASMQIMQAVLKDTLGPAFVLIGLGITRAILGYVLALAAAGLTDATVLFTRHARSSRHASDSVSMELRELQLAAVPRFDPRRFSYSVSEYCVRSFCEQYRDWKLWCNLEFHHAHDGSHLPYHDNDVSHVFEDGS